MAVEGLPRPTITWWLNDSQIGRQVMNKNFKIRGLRGQSELFVLPTSDRLEAFARVNTEVFLKIDWWCFSTSVQLVFDLHNWWLEWHIVVVPVTSRYLFAFSVIQILYKLCLLCGKWTRSRENNLEAQSSHGPWPHQTGLKIIWLKWHKCEPKYYAATPGRDGENDSDNNHVQICAAPVNGRSAFRWVKYVSC